MERSIDSLGGDKVSNGEAILGRVATLILSAILAVVTVDRMTYGNTVFVVLGLPYLVVFAVYAPIQMYDIWRLYRDSH